MKKQVAIITSVLTLGSGGFFFALASGNKTLTLEERVMALEARVQALEGNKKAVTPEALGTVVPKETKAAPVPREIIITPTPAPAPVAEPQSPPAPAVGTTAKWQNLALWRGKLSKGMPKADVISILGKPDDTVLYGPAGERWWYGAKSGGTIDISPDGHVESWIEPHL